MSAVVGVDLGATKIAAAVVLDDGTARHPVTIATPEGAEAVLDATAGLVTAVAERARADGISAPDAAGVGAAGVIDARGVVTRATDHIAGWAGTEIASELARRTGLVVTALNDVHAHAVGEALYGAGRGHPSVLLAAVGSGIGSAFVVDGVVQQGAHGAAGALGHVPCAEAIGLPCPCGRRGHLEAVASGPALLAAYRRGGGEARDLTAVCARARNGEPLARDVMSAGARAVGHALSGAIALVDPDIAIVTGGVARGGGPEWWAEMRGAAAEMGAGPPCPVLPAETGALSAVLGAGARARETVGGCTP